MKIAIMQPTYIPWAGYFNLIYHSDVFVFLDDVQFVRRSWQQRNRIVFQSREKYLTVPVLKNGHQLIKDVLVDDTQEWRKDHILTLFHAYGKHPFGDIAIRLLEQVLKNSDRHLVDINIALIRSISDIIGIKTAFVRSSELPVQGKKSDYLLRICKYFHATTYLSASGSRDYIEDEGLFCESDVNVLYQDFDPEPYPQKNVACFIPYMSMLDVISNIGMDNAKQYISKYCFY